MNPYTNNLAVKGWNIYNISLNFRNSAISFGFSDEPSKNDSRLEESSSVLNIVTFNRQSRYLVVSKLSKCYSQNS